MRITGRILLTSAAILNLFALTGCAPTPQPYVAPQGLSDVRGWNSKHAYNGTAEGIDINGEVGHPMNVYGPQADCEPSHDWHADLSISSGTLPPGLTMDWHSGNITGIPTDRGHWIVKTSSSSISCGGSTYDGYSQELRFHITGTGQVVQ